ncbi:MAG: phosphoenolpyruvate-protein phosphotransferase system enzyme [Clostridiales bacterium]|nr:phosphoenolpyruvate-protein phosphotransferase system enzyme [Clostridiales bacterium]
MKGIAASKGYAIGRAALLSTSEIELDRTRASSVEAELEALDKALAESRIQLEAIRDKAAESIGEEEAKVFDSHLLLLEDPEFMGAVKDKISGEKMRAATAVSDATDFFKTMFESLDDDYMRERAADMKDVGHRLVRNLLGHGEGSFKRYDETVLVAHDLTPSDTAQIDRNTVAAFITDIGGVTSHSAIMARSLEIPAVVGMKTITETVEEGMWVVVDAIAGEVILNPDEATIKAYREKKAAYAAEREKLKAYRDVEIIDESGRKILVAGNMGSLKDLDLILENGADGIGLFRTEFVFMDRESMPTEEEQFEIYKEAVTRLTGRPIVIRTLDIGGDKQIPYLPQEPELNPFLGLRAIRLCFEHEDMFKTQLRALLRASAFGPVQIMFPMIGAVGELKQAKAIVESCKAELRAEGKAFNPDVEVGIMIEIPSAAIAAESLAEEADFFSIGTNDLIQYTMAVDRMNPTVSHLYDPSNPAVLKLIEMSIQAAHNAGIWCGMCGEMARDPTVTRKLFDMGLDEFSVTGSAILELKQRISGYLK